MSLKDFHIVFISLSVLLLIFFAYWNFAPQSHTVTAGNLIAGVVSLIIAISLVIYEVSFIRKSRV